MKKKMIYKLDETQNIIVEVETGEQERQIRELNREFDREERRNRRLQAKTDSLDALYEETGFEPIDEDANPETIFIRNEERKEKKDRVYRAISALKPRYRKVVQMLFFENKTQGDVAIELGITQPAVCLLTQRIMSALRKILQEK